MYSGVVIGYCHGEVIRPAFVRSLVDVLKDGASEPIRDVIGSGGLYIADNRNKLIRRFLDETDGEWFWSLDSDIEFPIETLGRLLAAAREGPRIVAAAYWSDYADGHFLTWMRTNETGFLAFASLPSPGIYELAACGMGCTLIHRDVLESIRVAADERDPWSWFGHDLVKTGKGWMRAGEDVIFCVRARRVGYPTYGLADLVVGHHKVQAVWTKENTGIVRIDDPRSDMSETEK